LLGGTVVSGQTKATCPLSRLSRDLKKLDETGGNVSRTAELLGLERSNLYRKMKALGIAPKESKVDD